METIDTKDTIAALATGVGPSAIAIVRLSGEDSLDLADRIFRGATRDTQPSSWHTHTLGYGHIMDGNLIVDEVLLSVMRGPKTYTKEDVVEINCHGGAMAARKVLQLLLREGARLARPGEFTLRAFLNGRIDLAQGEAVNLIIRSNTEASHRMALRQLEGGLSRKIGELDERLIETRAHLEGTLDFPEDVEDERTSMPETLDWILQEVEQLLASYSSGRLLAEGVRVVIAGKPNVGKSSLLNRLLDRERVLVSSEPGTTRDSVDASVEWDGIQFSITDTAGIRDQPTVLESMGIEHAKHRIAEADLILLVLDGSQPWTELDQSLANLVQEKPGILILNKEDLPCILKERDLPEHLGNWKTLRVSCLTGQGITRIRKLLTETIWTNQVPDPSSEILVCEARHVDALSRTQNALQQALSLLSSGQPLDMLAHELRQAHEALGEIVGRTTPEALLDIIFSRFCVGK